MAPSRGSAPEKDNTAPNINLTRAPTATMQGETNPPITLSQTRELSPNRLRPTLSREPSIRITRLSSTNRPSSTPVRDERNRLQKTTSQSRIPQSTLGVPVTDISRQRTNASMMPAVIEDGGESSIISHPPSSGSPVTVADDRRILTPEYGRPQGTQSPAENVPRHRRRLSAPPGAFNVGRGMRSSRQYDSSAVDLLDVIGTVFLSMVLACINV